MFTRRGYVHSTFVLEFRSVQGCGMDRHGIYDMGRKTSTSIHSSLSSCHDILALCSHRELSGFTKDGSTPERRCTYHDVFSLLATMALLFGPRDHNVSDRTASDCDVELESYTPSLPRTSRRFCAMPTFLNTPLRFSWFPCSSINSTSTLQSDGSKFRIYLYVSLFSFCVYNNI